MIHEISPLDGRYRNRLQGVAATFSEMALMNARCQVELRYLVALDETGLFPALCPEERARIDSLEASFSDDDFARIKAIESEIRHDVKAVELFLREKLEPAHPEMIHFGVTSEDVNNLAYGLLLLRFREEEQLPQLCRLVEALAERVDRWKALPFPARTHGQPASPTTLGKELAVFLSRLLRQARQLEALSFRGKLNGATGNYSAFTAAFPDFDWVSFSSDFVRGLGLEPNPCTTQIEGYDAIAEYFAVVLRIDRILLGLDLDAWEYISRGDLIQRPNASEVGSSTMPHKVNPIRFENSEGNLTIANALLHAISEKLARSRMQRDLSDATVRRNMGVALAHGYLAIDEAIGGLAELDVDRAALEAKLDASPEVLSEAYQTILRAEGFDDPYELLRDVTRGRTVTLADLHAWIDGISVGDAVKRRMKALAPSDYVGLAPAICDSVLADARAWLAA